jgi:hypothetical protein
MFGDFPYPKVLAAAIRGEDGTIHTLPAPARHNDIRNYMVDELGLRFPDVRDEGFLCDDGYWYCRQDAKLFATKHNQLKSKVSGSELLSTDVW